MSGHAALAALAGEDAGFVAGLSWVPAEALAALVHGTGAEGPAESLETVVRALQLDFAFVPANELWAAEAVARLHDADALAIWAVSGVMGRLGDRVGWGEALRLTVAEPGTLAAPLSEVLHDALDGARAGEAAHADAILVADDLAGATGPLVAPDFVLDALLPCYHSIALEAHTGSLPVVFHSDGDIRAFLPGLARGGFAAVHLGGLGVEAFAASFAAARASGLAVIGGIEGASLVAGARRAGVHAGSLAAGGGLLVSDDGGLTSAEEVAAFATAVEAARHAWVASREGRA